MPATYITLSKDVSIYPLFHPGFFCLDMCEGVVAVAETAPPLVENTLVLTSGCEGRHSSRSCHYSDRAFDVQWAGNVLGSIVAENDQARRMEAENWRVRIRQRLGKRWDVLVEPTHIHNELDLLKP